MGFQVSARVVYWSERVSEIIAAALCMTLMVSLVTKAEDRFLLHQQLDTIEDQYAMSWSIDQPIAGAARDPEAVIRSLRRLGPTAAEKA